MTNKEQKNYKLSPYTIRLIDELELLLSMSSKTQVVEIAIERLYNQTLREGPKEGSNAH